MKYFNLRAKDKSNIDIAMQMNISESTVYSIAREVKRKMIKIL
jgi:DNA-binding CsgD family transcriptional regulator